MVVLCPLSVWERYFTFHRDVRVTAITPRIGVLHGGGTVSVAGQGFLNTTTLGCQFDQPPQPTPFWGILKAGGTVCQNLLYLNECFSHLKMVFQVVCQPFRTRTSV